MWEADADSKPGCFHLHLLLQLICLIADGKDNVRHPTVNKGLDLMQQYWFVGKLHQRFRSRQGEGSETCAITTHLARLVSIDKQTFSKHDSGECWPGKTGRAVCSVSWYMAFTRMRAFIPPSMLRSCPAIRPPPMFTPISKVTLFSQPRILLPQIEASYWSTGRTQISHWCVRHTTAVWRESDEIWKSPAGTFIAVKSGTEVEKTNCQVMPWHTHVCTPRGVQHWLEKCLLQNYYRGLSTFCPI